MGETSIQSANQATGPPANNPADHPGKKKKRHVATWIALASAATAIAAAVLSGLQVNLAGKQNTEAEQQQLVSLTSLIGQQFTQQGTAKAPTLKSLSGTAVEAQGLTAELTVEGQAGAVLIGDLNGDGVASAEYVEVGEALYFSGDAAGAITDYNDALKAPPYDATTRATALRFLGSLYYDLGRNVIAHQDFMRSTKVFGRHSLQTKAYAANTIAQSYLADAGFQIQIRGCRIAASDGMAARRVMGSYTANTIVRSYEALDTKEYRKQCASAG